MYAIVKPDNVVPVIVARAASSAHFVPDSTMPASGVSYMALLGSAGRDGYHDEISPSGHEGANGGRYARA